MPTIVAISGSLRRKSFNTMLLHAIAESAPPGTSIDIASIREIPLYDFDIDAASAALAPVKELKEKIAAADGLLLATPEYNHSLPGVLKNTIDWVSRPVGDIPRVFGDKPLGIVGATTGGGGTILAQAAWLPVVRALGMLAYSGPRVTVSHAAKVFGDDGRIQDPVIRAHVDAFSVAFGGFVARHRKHTGSHV